MAIIDKGSLMLLLGDDLDKFTAFMFDPDAAAIKWQFEQAIGFDFDSPVLAERLAYLASISVVSQPTVDRIMAENDRLKGIVTVPVPAAMLRRYSVVFIENVNEWVNKNIVPPDSPYSVVSTLDKNFIVDTEGSLPSPAVEVK